MLALSAIAYQQPVTRAALSRLVGHDISRDILGRLKSLGVIAPGPRAPMPGAPIAWVTTARFLEMFALGSLRDLPDLDALEAAGPVQSERIDEVEAALDDAFGLTRGTIGRKQSCGSDEPAVEFEKARRRLSTYC